MNRKRFLAGTAGLAGIATLPSFAFGVAARAGERIANAGRHRPSGFVTSKDGTRIAFFRSGSGPPLALVHGTVNDHRRWNPVLGAFHRHFTCVAVDRRGRGASGDAPHYAIAREFEDVAAVVDSLPEPAYLIGHSYGALCSLEAALLTQNIRKLVLYEPPVLLGGMQIPATVIDRIQHLLDRGERKAAVVAFFRDAVGWPPQALKLLPSQPQWIENVPAAPTIPRELVAVDRYVFRPERFRDLRIPTLLLQGGSSPPFLKAATRAVHAALANSKVHVMPGQQHDAVDTGTSLLAAAVTGFLTSV